MRSSAKISPSLLNLFMMKIIILRNLVSLIWMLWTISTPGVLIEEFDDNK